MVRDVSDKKRLERELKESHEELEMKVLQRTSQLQHAVQELESFCYSIAHDLRSPIRAIIGKCRIVDEDFGSFLPEEAKNQMGDLVGNARRLANLVDDLLEFARLGQQRIVRQRVDMTALARRLADEIVPLCHDGESTIEVADGITSAADPQLIEIVLRNLIENSCKYSGSNVTIFVGSMRLGGEETFYVKDNGIGFDMAYAPKLFLPFERLHRDHSIKGTGIGLANVKRIVERHGGRIWAEGTPGVGASFFFTLHGSGVPMLEPLAEPWSGRELL